MRTTRQILGYARVSSAEQAIGSSLTDQQEAIRTYAKAQGIKVARMYVEAESAVYEKHERREQVLALMRDVRAGDRVVVDKLDRWSRDPAFTYTSIRDILTRGAGFYAVGDQCDPSTYEGDTMLNVRVLVAREEHKRIRQRMVGTRRLLRDRGYYVDGLVPWGYRRAGGRGVEKNVLVVHAEEAEQVRRVFRLAASGHPISAIVQRTGATRDRVMSVLRSRVHLGEIRDTHGIWQPAKHAAIIDPALYAEARAGLAQRRNGRARTSPLDAETATWWLRDLARCALCDAKMGAAYAGPKDEGRRYYYRCLRNCTTRYVRVEPFEAACDPIVLARLTELRNELARPPKDPSGPKIVDVDTRRARLATKRARYVEAFADGGMSRDQFRAALAKLDEQRTRVDAEAQASPRATPVQRREALRSVAKLAQAWRRASPLQRRAIVAEVALSVGVAAGRVPAFVWRDSEDLARLEEE